MVTGGSKAKQIGSYQHFNRPTYYEVPSKQRCHLFHSKKPELIKEPEKRIKFSQHFPKGVENWWNYVNLSFKKKKKEKKERKNQKFESKKSPNSG